MINSKLHESISADAFSLVATFFSERDEIQKCDGGSFRCYREG